MIPPLFQHQKEVVDEDRRWFGNWRGTGSAKTRTMLHLARGRTLVIVPKQQKLDRTWEANNDRFQVGVDLTVISKEEFRRDWESLPGFETVIVDEAHNHFGVLPDTRQQRGVSIPKTSQIFEATLNYLKKHNPPRFYMLTATPASKPMNVWAIATLFGNKWDFFAFREKFYIQKKIGFRSIWLPRNTIVLKEQLISLVRQMGYVGKLDDWFDVPEQTHKTVYVGLSAEQQKELRDIDKMEADPMVKRTKKRTIENGCVYEYDIAMITDRTERMVKTKRSFKNEKIDYILERAEEFPKMLIFANYIAQVEDIAESLREAGFKVYTLTGQTKDRSTVVSEAENAPACIVVAQCGISAGYELKSVPCVIFASKSYRYLDYEQGLGRVLRADALKKNLYIHLVVRGGVDQACHDTIMRGEDFQEKIHA